MHPKIINNTERLVIGMQSTMHHNQYQNIVALWQRFMPQKKKIQNTVNRELIALQIYNDSNTLDKPFNIWACAEVTNLEHIPEEMTSFIIPGGQYAIFPHKGMDASSTYKKIMSEWLPNSDFEIDNRPHFQVMGDKYKNGSSDSEEDFYVPVKLKQ